MDSARCHHEDRPRAVPGRRYRYRHGWLEGVGTTDGRIDVGATARFNRDGTGARDIVFDPKEWVALRG